MKKFIAIIIMFCFVHVSLCWAIYPESNPQTKAVQPNQEQTQGQPPVQAKKIPYQKFVKGADGKYHEVYDNTLELYLIPCLWNKKGKPLTFDVYIIEKSVPKDIHTTIIVTNVKITPWGRTLRTQGMAATKTTSAGLLIYWAPGVILTATPT